MVFRVILTETLRGGGLCWSSEELGREEKTGLRLSTEAAAVRRGQPLVAVRKGKIGPFTRDRNTPSIRRSRQNAEPA